MSDPVSLVVTAVALTISVFSSYVAWVSLKIARQAHRPGFIQNLLLANQSAMQYPELLVDVHGIDPTTSPREARALVYLSVVLDGFVTATEIDYQGDFAKMARDLRTRIVSDGEATVLTRLVWPSEVISARLSGRAGTTRTVCP